VGAGFAVYIPIWVEYSRRPVLVVERAGDLNIQKRTPPQRLVHLRVVNRPLSGWRGEYLLRSVAAGCTVQITLISRSDGSRVSFAGRWSGHPEPWTYVPITSTHGSTGVVRLFDETKIAQTRVIDVSPGIAGQTAAIAIKTDGHASAYAFASESYFFANLENPEWALPHEAYDVEVYAEAGGIRSPTARFVLTNAGPHYTSMSLS
jgi:hypothetical protein